MPNIALAQLVVMTSGEEGRARVQKRIEQLLATRFPEVRGRTSTLELGPPVGPPFKIRLTAPSYDSIAPAADKIEALMRSDALARRQQGLWRCAQIGAH
jgi:multidrug efflux pump